MANVKITIPNKASKALSESVNAKARKGRKPLTEAEKSPAGRFDRLAGIRAAKVRVLCKGIVRAYNPDYCTWTQKQTDKLLKHLRNSIALIEEQANMMPENMALQNGSKPSATATKTRSIFND